MGRARINVDLDLYDIEIDIIPYLNQLTTEEKFEVMSKLSGVSPFTGVDMMNKFLENCNTGSSVHELKNGLSEQSKEVLKKIIN